MVNSEQLLQKKLVLEKQLKDEAFKAVKSKMLSFGFPEGKKNLSFEFKRAFGKVISFEERNFIYVKSINVNDSKRISIITTEGIFSEFSAYEFFNTDQWILVLQELEKEHFIIIVF